MSGADLEGLPPIPERAAGDGALEVLDLLLR